MSVIKSVVDVTLSDGMKLVAEARRRVKPYLPLAAELYNELAARSPVSLPKIDVDRLINDLYPKQDLDAAWAHDAEPDVPRSPVDDLEPEVADEIDAPAEAEPEAAPEPAIEPEAAPEPVVEVVPEPVAEAVPEPAAEPEPAIEPEPVVQAAPEPAPEPEAAPEPVAEPAIEPVAEVKVAKPKAAAKPKAKPRARKKDDAQQTLIAPAPAKPRFTLEGLLEMKKTDLLELARERKLDLKPSATKQAIAEAILAS